MTTTWAYFSFAMDVTVSKPTVFRCSMTYSAICCSFLVKEVFLIFSTKSSMPKAVPFCGDWPTNPEGFVCLAGCRKAALTGPKAIKPPQRYSSSSLCNTAKTLHITFFIVSNTMNGKSSVFDKWRMRKYLIDGGLSDRS